MEPLVNAMGQLSVLSESSPHKPHREPHGKKLKDIAQGHAFRALLLRLLPLQPYIKPSSPKP